MTMLNKVNNPPFVRAMLARRAAIVRGIRAFFDARGFIEVETPVRIAAPAPEEHIDCPTVLGRPVPPEGVIAPKEITYLRASPELQMKKLLAAGMDRIYQIGPCFREGEKGSRHNPEFTMIEWYRREATYLDIAQDLEELWKSLTSPNSVNDRLSSCSQTVPGLASESQQWSPERHRSQTVPGLASESQQCPPGRYRSQTVPGLASESQQCPSERHRSQTVPGLASESQQCPPERHRSQTVPGLASESQQCPPGRHRSQTVPGLAIKAPIESGWNSTARARTPLLQCRPESHLSPTPTHNSNSSLSSNAPFRRLRVREAYREFAGWDPWVGAWDQDRFDFDMATKIEPALKTLGGVFLMDYPAAAASLARLRTEGQFSYAERWEFYWNGLELANCFSELCAGDEQRARFEKAKAARLALGESDYPLDDDFLAAVPQMGNAAGVALGIDRLVMVLTGAQSISEVRVME